MCAAVAHRFAGSSMSEMWQRPSVLRCARRLTFVHPPEFWRVPAGDDEIPEDSRRVARGEGPGRSRIQRLEDQ